MTVPSSPIRCDGCGLPASADHLAERFQRLELATRYRPVHIGVLFVALSPDARHDFYGSPEADSLAQSLITAVDIPASATRATANAGAAGDAGAPSAALLEFQHRGYFMTYVSECPVSAEGNVLQGAVVIARLGPALILRIQRNYKPQKIALLGNELRPLVAILKTAGVGPLLLTTEGHPLTLPKMDDAVATAEFRASIATNK